MKQADFIVDIDQRRGTARDTLVIAMMRDLTRTSCQ